MLASPPAAAARCASVWWPRVPTSLQEMAARTKRKGVMLEVKVIDQY